MRLEMKCRKHVRPPHTIWLKATLWQTWPWLSSCSSPLWSFSFCWTVSSWATRSWFCQRRPADRGGRTQRRCSCDPPCRDSEYPTWPFPLCGTGGQPTCPCRSPSCPTRSLLQGRRPETEPGRLTGSGCWGPTVRLAPGLWGRRAPSGPRPPRRASLRGSTCLPAHHLTVTVSQAGVGVLRFYCSPAIQRLTPEYTWFHQTLQWWASSVYERMTVA